MAYKRANKSALGLQYICIALVLFVVAYPLIALSIAAIIMLFIVFAWLCENSIEEEKE